MLPDRVSNPGALTYESGALPIALWSVGFFQFHFVYETFKMVTVHRNKWEIEHGLCACTER